MPSDKWNMKPLPSEGCRRESGVLVSRSNKARIVGGCNGCNVMPEEIWVLRFGNMVVRLCDDCMQSLERQIDNAG